MKRTGIYRHGAGWRAVVSQGRSRPRLTRHFPAGTSLAVMQAWRADAKAASRVKRKQRVLSGTLEADAAKYLQAVTSLTTYADRCREIDLWVQALGSRRREDITPGDIRAVRDRWLTTPRSADDDRPVSAATVNKRLRALSNLWRVLDGKQAYNPVRDVDEAPEPHPSPRALSYAAIQAILDRMPTYRHGQWKQTPPPDWTPTGLSKARVRVRIMAYTGLTPKALMRVTPADVDRTRNVLTLPARKKGRGVRPGVVPLLPPAAEAFAELAGLDGFGPFNVRTLRYAFTRAATLAGYPSARLHDLRHALAAIAYETTGSLDVVMALLQHTTRDTTQRYTLAAAFKVLQAQTQPLVQHFGTTDPGDL